MRAERARNVLTEIENVCFNHIIDIDINIGIGVKDQCHFPTFFSGHRIHLVLEFVLFSLGI